jgi:hypothetical protein
MTWPACSRGYETSGETWVPHHGSRCKGIAGRVTSGRDWVRVPLSGAPQVADAPKPALWRRRVEPTPVGPGLNVDTGVACRKNVATILRISHAIPRPVHRSICSCKLTRPTLSSGSSWPSPPRMFSGRLKVSASRNQAGRSHLSDRLIDARLPLAQWTECSQPGKAVSTKERPDCSKVGPEVTENRVRTEFIQFLTVSF